MMRFKYIPGHGDSCPYTLLESTMPLARPANLVKSNGGGSSPSTVNSGKILSSLLVLLNRHHCSFLE